MKQVTFDLEEYQDFVARLEIVTKFLTDLLESVGPCTGADAERIGKVIRHHTNIAKEYCEEHNEKY